MLDVVKYFVVNLHFINTVQSANVLINQTLKQQNDTNIIWHKNTRQIIIPPANEVWGYIGITRLSVCLSVRLSVCLSVCLSVGLSVKSKHNLGYNFSTNIDKALILHMLVPCDNTFLSVTKNWPCDLDLDFWPTSTFVKT